MEGFWQDPPRYFELLVWPAYVEQHSYLFKNGDIDSGTLTQEAFDEGLRTPKKTDMTLKETMDWAIEALLDTRLEKQVAEDLPKT
jgi:nicotinamide/nicotinate riboside kinase